MFEMFTAVSIVLGICYTIYKLTELVARKKERMALIEKAEPGVSQPLVIETAGGSGFSALKLGCLLFGLGLGLAAALLVNTFSRITIENYEVSYFAFMMLCGGLGLIISWMIERKHDKK